LSSDVKKKKPTKDHSEKKGRNIIVTEAAGTGLTHGAYKEGGERSPPKFQPKPAQKQIPSKKLRGGKVIMWRKNIYDGGGCEEIHGKENVRAWESKC